MRIDRRHPDAFELLTRQPWNRDAIDHIAITNHVWDLFPDDPIQLAGGLSHASRDSVAGFADASHCV